MKLKAAKTKQKGASFAVAMVEKTVIENRESAMSVVRSVQEIYPDMHIVLVYDVPGDKPIYFGRQDIANKLHGLSMASIEWCEHEIPDPA